MKGITFLFIVSLVLSSCSHQQSGRKDTIEAKTNNLTGRDLNFIDIKYDWEVAYSGNARKYISSLKSYKKVDERKEIEKKFSDIRAVISTGYKKEINKLKFHRKLNRDKVNSRAKLSEIFYKHIATFKNINSKNIDRVTSEFIAINEDISTSERDYILAQSTLLRDYLVQNESVDNKRVIASVEDDRNDSKKSLAFNKVEQVNFVRAKISPDKIMAVLSESLNTALGKNSSLSLALSNRKIDIISDQFIKNLVSHGKIARGELDSIVEESVKILRISGAIAKKEEDATRELLDIYKTSLYDVYTKASQEELNQRLANLGGNSFYNLSREELIYILQQSYESGRQDLASEVVLNAIYKSLLENSLLENGLSSLQYDKAFAAIHLNINRMEDVDEEVRSKIVNILYKTKGDVTNYLTRKKSIVSSINSKKVTPKNNAGDVLDQLPKDMILTNKFLSGVDAQVVQKVEDKILTDGNGLTKILISNSLTTLGDTKGRFPSSIKKLDNEDMVMYRSRLGDVYALNVDELTFLLAADIATPETLRAIKSLGGDIDYQNKYGETALMLAVRSNRIENVKSLIELGANKEILSYSGDSALDIAQELEFYDIVDLLAKRATIQD